MLQIAAQWIEQESKDLEVTKQAYMAEHCPKPDLNGDQAALLVRPEPWFYPHRFRFHSSSGSFNQLL